MPDPNAERERLVAAVEAAREEADRVYITYMWAVDRELDRARRALAAFDARLKEG